MQQALGLGLRSVMFDASKLPYAENVAETRLVADLCHANDAWLEAELGEVGGKDGVHAPGARTDPDEAVAYVVATTIDALAVAVGTSHAMVTREAVVDLGLIARLRAAVPVPLVLHGSSGVPDGDLARAIVAGMTKINISTHLNHVFTDAVRDWLAGHPAVVDSSRLPGRGTRGPRCRGGAPAGRAVHGLTGMDQTAPLVGVVAAAPAIDRFHRVTELRVGHIHRPVDAVARAGGKGFNVGRAARTLGGRVLMAAPLAGETGRWIERSARAEGMDVHATWIPGDHRTCLSVASDADGSLTEFYEPPGPVDPSDWARFVADVLAVMEAGSSGPDRAPGVVLVSGRLPPGAPDDGLGVIVGPLVRRGALVCLDSDGPGLRRALAERPAVVKVNAAEASSLLGVAVDGAAEAQQAAEAIRALGPRCAVITLGRDGAMVAGEDGVGWRLTPVANAGRYPVGSGDAFLAGLGVGLARAMSLPDALKLAAGAAAANAEVPGAGVLDSGPRGCSRGRHRRVEVDHDVADREPRPGATAGVLRGRRAREPRARSSPLARAPVPCPGERPRGRRSRCPPSP